jgi:hypothetical protein
MAEPEPKRARVAPSEAAALLVAPAEAAPAAADVVAPEKQPEGSDRPAEDAPAAAGAVAPEKQPEGSDRLIWAITALLVAGKLEVPDVHQTLKAAVLQMNEEEGLDDIRVLIRKVGDAVQGFTEESCKGWWEAQWADIQKEFFEQPVAPVDAAEPSDRPPAPPAAAAEESRELFSHMVGDVVLVLTACEWYTAANEFFRDEPSMEHLQSCQVRDLRGRNLFVAKLNARGVTEATFEQLKKDNDWQHCFIGATPTAVWVLVYDDRLHARKVVKADCPVELFSFIRKGTPAKKAVSVAHSIYKARG